VDCVFFRFPPWPGIFFKLARCGYTLRVTSQTSINISDVNIEKIFEILGIQLSADIILMVYSSYRARKERDSVVFKYINISAMNIEKSLRFYAMYKLILCITGIQLSADII
jgi:hypothetical protein